MSGRAIFGSIHSDKMLNVVLFVQSFISHLHSGWFYDIESEVVSKRLPWNREHIHECVTDSLVNRHDHSTHDEPPEYSE